MLQTPTIRNTQQRGLIKQGRAESQPTTVRATLWTIIAHETSKQGWIKTTRAMNVPGGCLINTTTRHTIAMTCSEAMVVLQGITVGQLLKANVNVR